MRIPLLVFVALFISACTGLDVVPDSSYSRLALSKQQPFVNWQLEGRLSLSNSKESWSASLFWEHTPEQDELKLSGPLGQGATIIRLRGDWVSIDRGGGNIQTSFQPEVFIRQQLGMAVPISSLRHWIIGLPDANNAFIDTSSGFQQTGWNIEYKQIQPVGNRLLPRKMTVMNEQAKLKLIIEQWVIHGADER